MTKPYRYQLIGVKKIERFKRRALLADDMGLGKTLQSLLVCKRNPNACPIIVVCPAGLKENWRREAAAHINMRAEILEGTKPPRRRMRHSQILIINYDILQYWLEYLKALNPQTIILDECHRIKNRTAKCTKAAKQLCDGVPSILALSGTPMLNRPVELYPILSILRPKTYKHFTRFAQRYCQPRRRFWGWEYKGATHTKELRGRLLGTCMIRRRLVDVLEDLPPKRRIIVPLQITDRRQYDLLRKDFKDWAQRHNPRKNSNMMAEALRQLGYMKRLAGTLKMPAITNWIDNFLVETDQKLIVFGIHKAVLRPLHARYKNSLLIDGTIKGKHRQNVVDKFHFDNQSRILFGNLQAAGTGWNCKCTSTIAFAEMGWTPGEHDQAESRAHGLHRGQQGVSFTAYYLLGIDTIEEKLCKIIHSKQKTIRGIIDGSETKRMDVFKELLEVL